MGLPSAESPQEYEFLCLDVSSGYHLAKIDAGGERFPLAVHCIPHNLGTFNNLTVASRLPSCYHCRDLLPQDVVDLYRKLSTGDRRIRNDG